MSGPQTYGFMGSQPQQVSAAPGGAPAQASPLYGQNQDPQSQYLAAALAQLGKQPQGTATGLGENLLADALDQYALGRRQQQLAQQQANGDALSQLQQSMTLPPGTSATPQPTLPF